MTTTFTKDPALDLKGLTVSEIGTEDDHSLWDAYVLNHPMVSAYHLSGWRSVVGETFGHQTYYLIATDRSGKVRGVLPLVFFSSQLFGRFLVSMPFFNYGGLLVDGAQAGEALLGAAIDLARKLNASHIELRHQSALEINWPSKQHKVSMQLELPKTFEELWKAFSPKLRSQIKRPEKEAMFSTVKKAESLDDFYQVFSCNMRDLGTPVYSKRFFKNILSRFQEHTWICTVFTRENKAVASGFLLGFRDRLEIPWASSLRRFNRYSPNMLLYGSVLKFACEKGFRIFDFGRSTMDEGTYRFKKQWGAKPTRLFWHYWLSQGGSLPELNPQNPKYRTIIKIWKKLPVTLSTLIGPSIVKNIP